MLVDAKGAGIGFADRFTVEEIAANTQKEGGGLRTPRFRARFDQMQTDRVVEVGMMLLRRPQDVPGEPSIATADLYEVGSLQSEFRSLKYRVHFGELDFQ